jgi:hypothetical protein
MSKYKQYEYHALVIILSVIISFSCTRQPVATNYYFDPVAGQDNNTGTSASQPFQSLHKISELQLNAGDSLLLKGGAVFRETLQITCSGSEKMPVVIGSYGSSERPILEAKGQSEATVHVINSEYITIRDLEITNDAGMPVPGLHGLWVELSNYGTAHGIRIDNLFVHNVTGSCVREKKDGGHAIFIQNYHENKPDSLLSNFDDLIIENCHIKDCNRSGIVFWGNWIRSKWKPSTHVIIRHNLLEGIPGDGIVPVGCDSVIVEYNVMKDCPGILPVTEAADGIWPWSCDNAIVQYNIVSDHKSQVDAYGFDADWNCKNSLFRYNLSYNNDGGFMLVCNSGGWTPDWSIGNTGTKVQYNISINDGLRNYKLKENYFSPVIHCTGPIKSTTIEKNLFCQYPRANPVTDKTLISFTDWRGQPDSTFFRNNFIFSEELYRAVDQGQSTHIFCENNLFVGRISDYKGFESHPGPFNSRLWYDSQDAHWDNLLHFISDKTINISGLTYRVSDIIGVLQTTEENQ